MSSTKSLVATFLIGAAVLAAPASARPKQPHGPERGYDSLAQPVVQRTDYVLDLAAREDRVSPTERSRLNAWFGSLGIGYGDRIWVDEPYGPTAARQDVARVAAEYGLLLSDGSPVMPGALPPGTVRVIVSRSIAFVPGCPHFDNYRGPSSVDFNYGCSVNSNLAAMIADPSDLVLGQGGNGMRDSSTAIKAIKVYREKPPTGAGGLAASSSKGGN